MRKIPTCFFHEWQRCDRNDASPACLCVINLCSTQADCVGSDVLSSPVQLPCVWIRTAQWANETVSKPRVKREHASHRENVYFMCFLLCHSSMCVNEEQKQELLPQQHLQHHYNILT